MTIASTTIKTGPLEGDGSTNSFTYTFTVKASMHMKVIHTTALGVETTLSSSAYTVNNVGDAGGGTVTSGYIYSLGSI